MQWKPRGPDRSVIILNPKGVCKTIENQINGCQLMSQDYISWHKTLSNQIVFYREMAKWSTPCGQLSSTLKKALLFFCFCTVLVYYCVNGARFLAIVFFFLSNDVKLNASPRHSVVRVSTRKEHADIQSGPFSNVWAHW